MLLRFPRTSSPYALREFIDEPKLFKTYKHYNDWGERVGVTSVSDLNKLIINRKINKNIAKSSVFIYPKKKPRRLFKNSLSNVLILP